MQNIKSISHNNIYFYLLLILQSILAATSGPVISYFSQNIFQNIVNGTTITYYLSLLILTMGINVVLKFSSSIFEFLFRKKKSICIQDELLQKVLGCNYFVNLNQKETVNQIYRQTETYVQTFSQFSISFITSIALVIGSSIYLIAVNLTLFIISSVIIAAIFAISKRKSHNIQQLQTNVMTCDNELSAMWWEHIVNKEISPFLNPVRLFKKDKDKVEEMNKISIEMQKQMFPHIFISMFGSTLATILVVLIGSIFSQNGNINASELFGTALLIPGTTNAILGIPNLYNQHKKLNGIKQSLNSTMQLPQYCESELSNLENSFSSILIKDLEISYGDKVIVKDVNFELGKGTVTVLSGTSGSGKTTILNSLCRLIPINKGKINFGGQSIDEISRESLWKNICYLPSKPSIFPISLQQNILGENSPSNEYNELVLLFGLENISKLDKLDIDKLSSGERQKIAILKAIFSKKPIWFFDEPTSALDPESEKTILAIIKSVAHEQGIIVFIISHREETMKSADFLYKIDGGTITKGAVI